MSLNRLKISVWAVVLLSLTVPSAARAQLGLNTNSEDYEFASRARRYLSNRRLENLYQSRIRNNTILLGRVPSMTRLHTRPLLMEDDYGILSSGFLPRDRAGYWMREYEILKLNSPIALASVNYPQSTDYQIPPPESELAAWTTDAVIAAMRNRSSTAALTLDEPAASRGPGANIDKALESKADKYYESCIANFRAAQSTEDRQERIRLIAEARNQCDIVIQIDEDLPRGYLAEALISFQSGEFNTAIHSLELGIKRANSLENLAIDPSAVFGTSRAWEEMLLAVNRVVRTAEDPRFYLYQAYLAFLNGDLTTARDATERAIVGLVKAGPSGEGESNEGILEVQRDVSLENAKHFRDLLKDQQTTPKGVGN